MYKHVFKVDLGDFSLFNKAKKSQLLPVVLSQSEVQNILQNLDGVYYLMTSMIYGSGLRLKECLRLRVKDIDFQRQVIFVRHGKGKKDRSVPLPTSITQLLKTHIGEVKKLHIDDLSKGYGKVFLPYALEKKYPGAAINFKWQRF